MDGVDTEEAIQDRINLVDEELAKGQSMTDLFTNTLRTSMWGTMKVFTRAGQDLQQHYREDPTVGLGQDNSETGNQNFCNKVYFQDIFH